MKSFSIHNPHRHHTLFSHSIFSLFCHLNLKWDVPTHRLIFMSSWNKDVRNFKGWVFRQTLRTGDLCYLQNVTKNSLNSSGKNQTRKLHNKKFPLCHLNEKRNESEVSDDNGIKDRVCVCVCCLSEKARSTALLFFYSFFFILRKSQVSFTSWLRFSHFLSLTIRTFSSSSQAEIAVRLFVHTQESI